ncbi:MAG TPA: hypothetical protein PLS49_05325, partial [Candidatus Woesebacteria bacterium]|nr:hypothetical protein [Candidatus Woesebacteria bacterium]
MMLFLPGAKAYQKSIADWTAGSTYNIVVRWDTKNTLDGTNYVCFTIDNVNTCGLTQAPSSDTPYGKIGSDSVATDALIEGLTVYRRILYEGGIGTNLGNGNEISQIFNSSSGKDPTLVTGSWDVVFSLPVNGQIGEIATGTGNAWSHPHSSNILDSSTTNTGGFMMNGVYTGDGWSSEGSPSSVEPLVTNEKIFSGGYKITSDELNEGIYRDVATTGGADYVVRAIVNSDGSCSPRVIMYNQTDGTEVVHYDGSPTSTKGSPDNLLFTGEVNGTGAKTLRIKLVNTQSSGSCYWHQVELLNNAIDNPSLEYGSGDPWMPGGSGTYIWSNFLIDAGDTQEETSIVRSGQKSMRWNQSASGESMYIYSLATQGGFLSLGGYFYGDEAAGFTFGSRDSSTQLQFSNSLNKYDTSHAASWSHEPRVLRYSNLIRAELTADSGAGTGGRYVDDVYWFRLNDVSLSIGATSESNSSDASGFRVDGYDTMTQPITGLSANKGVVKFKYTPRRSAGIMNVFGNISYVVRFGASGGESFGAYWQNSNELQMFITDADGTNFATAWNAVGSIVGGTSYNIEFNYDSQGIRLLVDDVVKLSITDETYFSTIPETVWWGTNSGPGQSCDCTINNFSSFTPSENTLSTFNKFGSKSLKIVNSQTYKDTFNTTASTTNSGSHTLSTYVYDYTSGNIAGTVSD